MKAVEGTQRKRPNQDNRPVPANDTNANGRGNGGGFPAGGNLAFIQHLNPNLNFLGGLNGARKGSGLREVQSHRVAGRDPLSENQKGKGRADVPRQEQRQSDEVVSLLD